MPEKLPEPASSDFCTILICAIRYSLGRRTYITGEVCRIATANMALLDDKTVWCAERDIRNTCDLGDPIDAAEWEKLLCALQGELKRRGLNPA